MNRSGHEGMWDEEDGFYYEYAAPRWQRHATQSPFPGGALASVCHDRHRAVATGADSAAMAGLLDRLRRIPELGNTMHPVGPGNYGVNDRGLLAVLNPERLRRVLTKMLDENEFFGPYGIRSISKFHERHPYVFHLNGQEYRVDYLPAESNTGMFGGNSNGAGRSGCRSTP